MTKLFFSLIMAAMKNKPQRKLPGLAGLSLALLVLLAACQDQPGSTATPPVSPPGNSPGQSVTSAAPATSGSRIITATPTLIVTAPPAVPGATPVTPTPAAVDQSNPALNQLRPAIQKMTNEAKTFRYKLQQTGELNSGGSLSRFEASGSGEFQRPAFHQLLTLKVSGQTQEIEYYGRGNQLFQRVVSLVAWRALQPAVAGPFPGLNQAQGFKAAGKESLNSQPTTKYSWVFPANQLLPGSGQPEGLGALSVTGLYQAFSGDKTSQAQAAIWVDDTSGFITRYQVTTNFTNGNSTLSYNATYDYTDFDSPDLKVEAPGDLPK
jgi:hypothetical protein